MADRLDYGFRCEGRFAAAREEVGRQRAAAEAAAAAAAAAVPSTTAPPKKLRAKKQAAQAAIEARAEREFQARYDDHQNAMFVRLGMSEYYGSEGFDRPPPDVYSCLGGFVFSTRVATRAASLPRVASFGDDGAGA